MRLCTTSTLVLFKRFLFLISFIYIYQWYIHLINLCFLFFCCFSLNFIFGAITMIAGILGICFGFLLSKTLRSKFQKADPIICGVGLLLSAPFLLSTTFAVTKSSLLSYILLLAGEVTLNLNWAICGDILLVRFFSKKKLKQNKLN